MNSKYSQLGRSDGTLKSARSGTDNGDLPPI